MKEVTEDLNQQGVEVCSKDTASIKSCGFVTCMLPPSQTLSTEQEQEIFHCWKELEMEFLSVSMHGIQDYTLSKEMGDIKLTKIHNVKDSTCLVQIILKQINPKGFSNTYLSVIIVQMRLLYSIEKLYRSL